MDFLGITNPQKNVIVLHGGLKDKEFAHLRLAVMNHEFMHIKEKTYARAIIREIKDYHKLYAIPEFWQFKKKHLDDEDKIGKILYNVAMAYITGISMLVGFVKFRLRKWKQKSK